jgi:hypothetical protein
VARVASGDATKRHAPAIPHRELGRFASPENLDAFTDRSVPAAMRSSTQDHCVYRGSDDGALILRIERRPSVKQLRGR